MSAIDMNAAIALAHQLWQAEQERALLARALNAANDGILITDRNSTIVFVNQAFEALTGYSAAELLGQQAGVKLLHIPYKGNSAAIIDVIAGNVQLMFDQVSTAKPYVDSGKLRALGVTSLKRSPLFPDVPTIDESGLKGYEEITFNGLLAPTGAPRDALIRVQTEVSRIVRLPELRKRYIERGIELVASASPEEFTAAVKTEFEKKARLARDTGMRLE